MTNKTQTTENVPVKNSEAAKPVAPVSSFQIPDDAVVKILTRPILSYKAPGTIIGFQPIEAYFVGEVIDEGKEPAKIMNCQNLADGQPVQIVVSAILRRELDRYPDNGYIGRCFAVQNTGTKLTRKANNVTTITMVEMAVAKCAMADPSIHPEAVQ